PEAAARDEQHDPDHQRQAGHQECKNQHHRRAPCRTPATAKSIGVGNKTPETARAAGQYA
ncbi:hypothetical protein, partial [Burkholderia contaminans]|uniref:hypothetical protein n=1 Tax=Burkholderia contaminans TaxID=488447 RepID=UPI00311085F9